MKSYNKWANRLASVFEHERSKNDIEEIYPSQMPHVLLALELQRPEPLSKINRLINSSHAPIIRYVAPDPSYLPDCETVMSKRGQE